jgi:hypothetical protein
MIPNTDRLNLRKLSSGTWTLRKQHNHKRFELSLGTSDKEIAKERAKEYMRVWADQHVSETWAETVREGAVMKGWLWVMWNRCVQRRPTSGLTLEQITDVALRTGGKCSVSGIPFVLGHKRHPYQPSIDRIVSGDDYNARNVRLVCLSVNYCMHAWGEEVFKSLAISMAARYLERAEREQVDRFAEMSRGTFVPKI